MSSIVLATPKVEIKRWLIHRRNEMNQAYRHKSLMAMEEQLQWQHHIKTSPVPIYHRRSASARLMPTLPIELKALASIAARADELETIEPVISYWSRYWIVQKSIVAQNEARSAAVETYLVSVLEQLEHMRDKHKDMLELENTDAGRKKVESFALQVFDNVDREEKAGKAVKATALKFMAAASFLEVCQVFGTPEKDIIDKRKYAKVQAMRIQTAFAAGKDPNEYRAKANQKPTEILEPTAAETEELDALLQGTTVQADPREAGNSELSPSIHPERHIPSVPDQDHEESVATPRVIEDTSYFPSEESQSVNQASSAFTQVDPVEKLLTSPRLDIHNSNSFLGTSPQVAPVSAKDEDVSAHNVSIDDETIAASQKHAKFAISALNYEDIETAIAELKKALRLLEAQ